MLLLVLDKLKLRIASAKVFEGAKGAFGDMRIDFALVIVCRYAFIHLLHHVTLWNFAPLRPGWHAFTLRGFPAEIWLKVICCDSRDIHIAIVFKHSELIRCCRLVRSEVYRLLNRRKLSSLFVFIIWWRATHHKSSWLGTSKWCICRCLFISLQV